MKHILHLFRVLDTIYLPIVVACAALGFAAFATGVINTAYLNGEIDCTDRFAFNVPVYGMLLLIVIACIMNAMRRVKELKRS